LKIPSVKTETTRTITQVIRILIFCTSFQTKEDAQKISSFLDRMSGVKSWTMDLEDCDRVLHMVCETLPVGHILNAIETAGFNIWEMAD